MLTFEDVLKIIQKHIDQIPYPDHPADLYAPIRYILSLKGKKIRPALTLLAYNLYKDDVEAVVQPALAWEIFHNFTLMHDDVMDKADIRRGRPTVHKAWNDNTAILSGDSMLILAYQTMVKASPEFLKPLLDLFSTTAAEICEGQQYDMKFETRLDVTEAEYLEMIRLKTAVMLGACLKSGAIAANSDADDAQHLYDFGMNLGLAFQIKDDLLDIYGNPLIFGKATGGDILCNKKTYFLINALALTSSEDKRILLEWLNTTDYNPDEKIEVITNLYNKYDLKMLAEAKMNEFYKKAIIALNAIRLPEDKKVKLNDFAMQIKERIS